jgi:hypothetical protein
VWNDVGRPGGFWGIVLDVNTPGGIGSSVSAGEPYVGTTGESVSANADVGVLRTTRPESDLDSMPVSC